MPALLALALAVLVAAAWLVSLALLTRRYLHMLQLEEYSNRRFLHWAQANSADTVRIWRWAGVLAVVTASLCALMGLVWPAVALFVLSLAPSTAIAVLLRPQPAKKPLVYTARIRRLMVASVLLLMATVALVAVLLAVIPLERNPFAAYIAVTSLSIALLLLVDFRAVIAANVLARPVEAALRQRYVRDAHRRVRRLAPRVIAVTGSFGKTTTKELLAAVLSTRFATMKTPESWNTLMGVTRTIRERLTAEHELFVVEMGAYKRGEIAELCELTGPPSIGILTGINEQHLERFGGIENTIKAKYELIQAVQPGGLAIFNADNAYCRELAARTTHARVARVGLNPDNGPFEYTADGVSVSPEGTRFTVHAGQESAPFRTRLLGEHFIINVLAATAAARDCGMTLQQVAAAVAAVPPVAHRLQLLPSTAGVTTIDDAYSANPDGARAALHVLKNMNGGRRILVTPGFIELGDREAEFNRDLGQLAASSCDILVLVGPRRTQPIRDGAVAAGMDTTRIEVVASVADAHSFVREVAASGDTILFENDLPDNYDE